jgi:thioredoxin reductase/NAD-dependent dihydropyrimidine dehydrogenase PreA subunit
MAMILTTLVFILITVGLVWMHVRREKASREQGRACPRCRAVLPEDARRCPSCGVPLQIFELVTAPKGTRASGPGNGREHAVVRADLCVGCGACVEACPEPGAITLRDKLAVVDRSRCVGHGECVRACPVAGIFMSGGAAVHHVRVPELSPWFETNVRGMYVVGELGGRGLIKNAINEGKIAMEHAVRSLTGPAPADPRVIDVIVVGSGPAGLSAGLEAVRSGVSYAVLEQGTLADSIRKYPRHKVLLAEPVRIPLYGDLWVADGSKEALLQMWEKVIATTGLQVLTGCHVMDVERAGNMFRLATNQGDFLGRRVVLALGRRGTPRKLDVPGEDQENVFYDIVEMETFRDRRVLVVGGGDSAVESAVGLAKQPGTRVHLAYRGTQFQRVKDRNLDKLEAAVKAGTITLLLQSEVREIRRGQVLLDQGGTLSVLPTDDVVVRIGGEAPFEFLERLGVRLVEKDLSLGAEVEARAV